MGNTASTASTAPNWGVSVPNPIQLAGRDSLSLLGTPFAPVFPPFLKNNPLPNGFPWGSL
ncbi:Multicopper oxidase [Apiospora aurea]|uniref:Multicopper oxidase n=1 Tax=Apiospora aurea TaxID=335848 RepID=A0ABR1QZC6_9PEZI